MRDASQVRYRLSKPNLVQRSTRAPSSDAHATNQRWLFAFDLQMSTDIKSIDQQTLVRVRLVHVTQESPSRNAARNRSQRGDPCTVV